MVFGVRTLDWGLQFECWLVFFYALTRGVWNIILVATCLLIVYIFRVRLRFKIGHLIKNILEQRLFLSTFDQMWLKSWLTMMLPHLLSGRAMRQLFVPLVDILLFVILNI